MFLQHLRYRLSILNDMVDGLESAEKRCLQAMMLFVFMTRMVSRGSYYEILSEQGLQVDEEGFEAEMDVQRKEHA